MEGKYDFGELRAVILEHLARYPLMELRDIVKLMYQQEMGCAHMLEDTDAAYSYLKHELASVEADEAPLLEDIGGGFSRLDLRAAKALGITAEGIFDLMVRTATSCIGSIERFEASLGLLKSGDIPIPEGGEPLDGFLEKYSAAGYPPIHHSERFTEAYSPAYRVIKTELVGPDALLKPGQTD